MQLEQLLTHQKDWVRELAKYLLTEPRIILVRIDEINQFGNGTILTIQNIKTHLRYLVRDFTFKIGLHLYEVGSDRILSQDLTNIELIDRLKKIIEDET